MFIWYQFTYGAEKLFIDSINIFYILHTKL